MAQSSRKRDFVDRWHHAPAVPVATSPLFALPFRPVAALKWLVNSWLVITEQSVLIGFALISWFYFAPTLAEAAQLKWDWVLLLWGRNLGLMLLVAGGLHLFFYTFRRQQARLQYDTRPIPGQTQKFTFGSQVRDNMFWSLASGVSLWTLYEVGMVWAMANGYAPVLYWADNPVWFVALFALTPLWISFHFYWVHRWMHWPPLYRIAHAVHHRNTNVGPWSGLSMHPIETLLFFSSILVHFVIASHPLHILFHLQHQGLTAATSHTGFEAFQIGNRKHVALGRFHHQIHHRYFDCNYGNLEMPWDKLFGSFHDGTDAAHEAMIARKKRMGIGSDQG